MKIAIVLGTRPEIIKMSPIIRECERLSLDYFTLHTGQHYSYDMDRIFFENLRLPEPKYNLNIGSGTHAEETSKALTGIERTLQAEKPKVTLVQGDTNTVLAGALAATKLGMSVGHVEAGLRSYDRGMPEEINRVLADHISHILFAPTERARANLLKEGISPDKIYVTGNTIVDCLIQNVSLVEDDDESIDLVDKNYFLLTLHRQENVDHKERLECILDGLKLIYEEFGLPMTYPIHPRTRRRIHEFGLTPTRGLNLIDPVGYLAFLRLEKNARLILTDSGGVQEEACILKVPCVTLRYNTERPETLEVGANTLAGTEPEQILEKTKIMLNVERNWENPFGDGTAGSKIINTLLENFGDS
nr:UDP-N-acetylglucosamine 2-epimerase (non-hydrolyzing) [Candidatus Njordarchaeota archaeon]